MPATTGGSHALSAFAGTLVLMLSLSFLWGVLYHVGRHGWRRTSRGRPQGARAGDADTGHPEL